MNTSTVTVNDVLDGQVRLDIQCLDRIYLNVYVPKLQTSAQVVALLSDHLGFPFPSPGLFNQMGQRFRRALTSFADAGMPITAPVRDAIVHASAWIPALDTDGQCRDGAEIVEITHLVEPGHLAGYPDGTRLICRRERPHPGAQLDMFDTIEGFQHQVVATATPVAGGGSIQYLEVRHRGHARVEDRIRTGKDCGFGRFPSRQFAINQAWLELALAGIDLTRWTQLLRLDGQLAKAEPKKLRYRLLHTAARIVRTGRRILLRINASWPWASDLAQAYTRLAQLPRPLT